jgi:hypothetical protein
MSVLRSAPMSYLVVVLLSLLWLGFFLPGLLQARRTSSPLATATTFQESLTRISTGHAVTGEEAAEAARRRRRKSRREIARQRDILAALSAVFIGTLAIAVAFDGPIRWLVAPAALGLVGYVIALRLQVMAASEPPPLPLQPPAPASDIVLSVRRREAAGEAGAAGESRELERIAG